MTNDKYFVCFFDILGFKNLITDTYNNSDLNNNIKKIKNILEISIQKLNKKHPWSVNQFKWNSFSDCFCIYIKEDERNFDAFLNLIASMQASFHKNNILIRGGATLGFHYSDEYMIFSPALIEAYKLENESKYPRIILSEKLKDYGRNSLPEEDIQYFYDSVSIDLYDQEVFFDFGRFMTLDDLHNYKDFIIENLSKFEDNKKIKMKFLWLAYYHNSIINEFHKNYPKLLINKVNKNIHFPSLAKARYM